MYWVSRGLSVVGLSLLVGCASVSESTVAEMSDSQLCQAQAAHQPPNAVGRITIGVLTLGVSEFAEMQRRQDRRMFETTLRERGVTACP